MWKEAQLPAIIGVLFLDACEARPTWRNPALSADAHDRDIKECRVTAMEASVPTHRPRAHEVFGPGVTADEFAPMEKQRGRTRRDRKEGLFERCLTNRGYRLQEP